MSRPIHSSIVHKMTPGSPTADIQQGQYTGEEMNYRIADKGSRETERAVKETEDLVDRATNAHLALSELAGGWHSEWMDFIDTTGKRLTELRMHRMALESEMRQLMAGCRDVRQFFLDKDFELERSRLKEFVEMCERLKALKDSGFLDTVADTMLRLSVEATKV